MRVGTPLSGGSKALPDKISSFASTQAAWRFYGNASVTLSKLQEPLMAAGLQGSRSDCDHFSLCVHDWSRLHYKHNNKADKYAMTHVTDIGYELQSSLLISDRQGQPIAPVAQRLQSGEGSYSSYTTAENDSPVESGTHLDELSDCIDYLESRCFDKPLVHIIDRESDSAGHLRAWDQAGYHWLVRVKANSSLTFNGQKSNGRKIAEHLSFTEARPVTYKGKTRVQYIAEAEVELTRPAKPSRKKLPKPVVPGVAISARLVVSRIVSPNNEVLAEWFLLSNLTSKEADTKTLALWYYWRWKIESFFKLMKSAGFQLESWQQTSALAIAKRLLVASMACVTVWAIAASQEKSVSEFRDFLIKLSGRQVRKSVGFSHPALLDGLWTWLAMTQVMQDYSPEELDNLRKVAQRFV